MQFSRQILRYGVRGGLAAGVLYGGYQFVGNPSFDPYNIGAARFGRAAFTVSENFRNKDSKIIYFGFLGCQHWIGLQANSVRSQC